MDKNSNDRTGTALERGPFIYVLDRECRNTNEKGDAALLQLYADMNPGAPAGSVSIMSGPELDDPVALAAMLEAGRKDDLVVVILEDEIVPCRTGPGPDGLEAVIGILKEDIEKGYGHTSWEALSTSILEHRKEA